MPRPRRRLLRHGWRSHRYGAPAHRCMEASVRRLPARRAAASGEAFVPFDTGADYLAYVDGRPREDGVRLFLASRGIRCRKARRGPRGRGNCCRAQPPQGRHVRARRCRPAPTQLPGRRAVAAGLRRLGIRTAVVSSSRNCAAVLEAAGLSPLCGRPGGWDGCGEAWPARQARARPVPGGRAAPDAVEPRRGILFEDALAGVEAGRRGGFGQVVGVDIGDHAAALLSHGAEW